MKDFDSWNEKKKLIDVRPHVPFYHAREIWWCSLGMNIGFEQDGAGKDYYRPVLILKGMSRSTCFVIPLTSSLAIHRLRPSVGLVGGKQAKAILSQLRLIDVRRLVSMIGYLDKEMFMLIRKAARDML